MKGGGTFVVGKRVVMPTICSLILVALVLPLPAFAQAGAASAARGQTVYAEQKCAVCHSIAGKGNPKGSLDDVGSRLSADEIRLWIADPATMTAKTKAGRKPPMKAYANIAKDDLETLVAYMQSLKKR